MSRGVTPLLAAIAATALLGLGATAAPSADEDAGGTGGAVEPAAETTLGGEGGSSAAGDGPVDGAAAAVDGAEAAGEGGDGAGRERSQPRQRRSKLKMRLRGLRHGKLNAGDRVTAVGKLRPWRAKERVTVILRRGRQTIERKTMFARKQGRSNVGRFRLSEKLLQPGRYSVRAVHKPSPRLSRSRARTRAFKIRYPDLDPGDRNSYVRLFNRLLEGQGYVNDGGKRYDGATERAVLAFRKVNKMSRITDANRGIFKKLARRKGGYNLRYPNSGKHVEVDLSRQVMVLAKGDDVKEIYHVSTGAPATPTPTGTWRFERKQPGYNSVEMYYSVYWYRGYATHGYKSVPTYPASHGCVRNPPADSKHIYNWIDIGDLIHIYN